MYCSVCNSVARESSHTLVYEVILKNFTDKDLSEVIITDCFTLLYPNNDSMAKELVRDTIAHNYLNGTLCNDCNISLSMAIKDFNLASVKSIEVGATQWLSSRVGKLASRN